MCATTADCSHLGAHHVCDSTGVCVCEDGWGGAHCDVVYLIPIGGGNCSSTPAVVDVTGACCEWRAAIDSVTGVCCGDAATDGNGQCCAPNVNVDPCGVCGGDGVAVDAAGVCCSTALPPSGLCCNVSLDSCGVCGGTNDCMAVVTVALPLNITSSIVTPALGESVANVTLTVTGPVRTTVSRE